MRVCVGAIVFAAVVGLSQGQAEAKESLRGGLNVGGRYAYQGNRLTLPNGASQHLGQVTADGVLDVPFSKMVSMPVNLGLGFGVGSSQNPTPSFGRLGLGLLFGDPKDLRIGFDVMSEWSLHTNPLLTEKRLTPSLTSWLHLAGPLQVGARIGYALGSVNGGRLTGEGPVALLSVGWWPIGTSN